MTKVIHAHFFKARNTAALIYECNDVEKCLTLFFGSVRPNFVILECPVGFFPRKTMQVFQTFIAAIGVAFDVVKKIASIWCGQHVEATEIFDGQDEFGFGQCSRV